MRSYVHNACGAETRVDGFDLYRLANPFFFILASTKCSRCGGVTIDTTHWRGHDRSMWRHRADLRQRRFWIWFLWPITIAVGVYGGYRLIPPWLPNIHDPVLFGLTLGLAVGLATAYFLVPAVYHLSISHSPIDDIPK